MNEQVWKMVAKKWRTLEETVVPLSIVEEVTIQAVNEIKEAGLIYSALDFLKSDNTDDDDDDDWP